MSDQEKAGEPTGISRRTVTKAAVWAVPAIAVATAIPIASASQPVTATQTGPGCKLPGNSCGAPYTKGYLATLSVCATLPASSNQPITFTLPSSVDLTFSTQGGKSETLSFAVSPTSFSITGKGCQTIYIDFYNNGASPNAAITGTLSWSWTWQGQSGSGTTPISIDSTNPCTTCP